MKRSVVASLSALALSLVATPAFANSLTAVNQNSLSSSIVEITP